VGTNKEVRSDVKAELAALRRRIRSLEAQIRQYKEMQMGQGGDLPESHAIAQALMNANEDYVAVLNRNGVFLQANEATGRRFGVTRESLVGRSTWDFFPAETSERRRAALETAFETGQAFRLEDENQGRCFDHVAYPVSGPDGKISKAVVIGRDITRRKSMEDALRVSEERYRLVSERTSDLVAITTFSLTPKYTYLSPSHKKILGYDLTDLLNRSALDFIHPDDLKTLLPLLEKYVVALKAQKNHPRSDLKLPTERMLYRLRDKSGAWRYLETTGDLLDYNSILFVSRDVTDKVRAEEELLKSKVLLESQVWERTQELAKANDALRQEVSERARKEAALKESETRYKTILESIEDGYFEVDPAGDMRFFNSALCTMTGYSPAELLGMNNRDYTEPAMAKRMFEIFNRIYRTGEPSKISDYEVIKKDGTKCIVELSTSLMRDSHGSAIGFRGIARDVTERERIKSRLKESEEKYRNIIQSMEEGYYEVDLRGNLVFLNDALSRILGYSPEELVGMNNRQYMSEQTAKAVYKAFNEVYRTGKSTKAFDWEVIRKDSEKRCLETSVSLFHDSGVDFIGFRGIARDVTERRLARKALEQSEEKYRTILQSIEDGYYEVDISGNMVFFNDSMCRMLGYSPEELKGMNNRMYMTEETAKTVYLTFNQVYRTGDPTRALGWELVRKDGQKRYVETSVSLIRSKEGEPVGFRGIARDITEQKTLEKARERIINHLSHELGTPLSIIEGALGRISKAIQKADLSKIEEWVERAGRNVGRLKDLKEKIDDILKGSPVQEREKVLHLIETALWMLEELKDEPLKENAEAIRERIVAQLECLYKMEDLQTESIQLDTFLEEVRTEATKLMNERQIDMVEVFERGICVEMNRKVLKKVCDGFLRNAIENTPDEGKIEITLKSGDRIARIDFHDFGIGITSENKKLIFGGFFHTQDSLHYASKKPYLFNAGGSGSDLLRAKVLSERFNFSVNFTSHRCRHLPTDKDQCPGKISSCTFIKERDDCLSSGESIFSLVLPLK
jgi:PAS domain S-box-containing protein